MQYLQIEGLNKPVCRLSLGTGWFGSEQEAEIHDILDAYIELGGNILDTGRFYNGGKSEPVVAKWLQQAGCRDRLIITNKACHHYVDENNVHHIEQRRVRPACITEDMLYSLENMRLSHFDIYLLHRDDECQPVEGLIDRLEQHRREGLITVYGVSNWSIPRIEQANRYAEKMGYTGLRVNSPSYSLATVVKPRFHGCIYADDAYIAWHGGKRIQLVVWASLTVGFFADAYRQDGRTPADIVNTYFCKENFEKLDRVKQMAAKKNVEPVHIALAYVLSQPIPMISAIGPRTAQELQSLMSAIELQLCDRELSWLKTADPARSYA